MNAGPGEFEGKLLEGAHLDIDAHAVYQLGAQLITDDEQALLELVKNSYDAEASMVGVRVNTNYVPRENHPFLDQGDVGYIEIEDDALGMDKQGLLRSWLVISLSSKRVDGSAKVPSPNLKRYPMGDKGLGRLGSMKLGRSLMVESFTDKSKPGYRVFFRWTDCRSGQPLGQVPVRMEAIKNERERRGTTVRICGLHDPAGWKAERRAKRLQTKLSVLISPFQKFRDFVISISVDSVPVELASLTDEFRETSPLRMEFDWDGARLRAQGRLRLNWFKRKDVDGYNQFIAIDHGVAFIAFLKKTVKGFESSFGLKASGRKGWLLEFERFLKPESLFKELDVAGLRDPGPFRGEIDVYDLESLVSGKENVFSSLGLYREYIRSLNGVYVYRDRFGVRMAPDWLRLGEAFTGGYGFYSMRPSNSIGFVQLTVASNDRLIEKSDREGFVENEAYRGFIDICGEMIERINETLNLLGKKGAEFLRVQKGELSSEASDGDSDLPPPPEVGALTEALKQANGIRNRLAAKTAHHQTELTHIDAAARRTTWTKKLPPAVKVELDGLQQRIEREVKSLEQDRNELDQLVQILDQQSSLAAKFRRRYEEFSSKSQLLYEMVGVGLAAQTLAHDIGGLTGDITSRTAAILKELRRRAYEPEKIVPHVEGIRSAVAAITASSDLIRPMLRANRTVLEIAPVSKIVRDFMEQRGERLRTNNILWELVCEHGSDFSVKFNRGRFVQIFENLLSNSEYWLKQFDGKSPGRITIKVERPNIIFWDSGRGVRDDLEDRMFELFVSGKPKGEGNGLGLFIISKLLERDQCSIVLDSERNSFDRRYKFVVNLTGILEV